MGPVRGDPLPRYRGLIPDWKAFADACRSPLPTALRTNSLRTTTARLRDRLAARRIRLTPVPWDPDVMTTSCAVGRSLEHWLGLFYISEATQGIPVLVLAPQPDHRVLDLCAAPGGKTVQIAIAMRNQGLLVANEPSGRRQPSLLANVNRLGVLNALVTDSRGEFFPITESFDRILVDAPCSGEGTLRKDPSIWEGAHPRIVARLARLQKRILLRAFDLLAPAGRLVYSTCTLAPEENEGVVAHLLNERDAMLLPVPRTFSTASGITTWAGASYPADVEKCVRIYPHHLNSGGGFVAYVGRRNHG